MTRERIFAEQGQNLVESFSVYLNEDKLPPLRALQEKGTKRLNMFLTVKSTSL